MKVLIADSLHESAINGLQSLGIDCIVMPGLSAEKLPSRLADVDILIVRSTKVGKEAIEEKGLKVALDVYEDEPSGGDAEFPQSDFADKITATPHIGASTSQASEAIAEEVIRIVKGFIETAKAPNCVNIQSKSPAPNNLVVRHYNRVGVLARVLDELKDEGINIEEMENTIFQDGHAASCMLKLDDKPSEDLIHKLRKSEDIIRISLK